jgi:hypothetical protein
MILEAGVSQGHAEVTLAFGELKHHNDLLGDLDALDRAWIQDGYWFFKAVLDRGAVARLRAKYVEELKRLGVIDDPGSEPTDRSVLYNGRSLADLPDRMEPFAQREPWRDFAAEPAIHAFLTRLLGTEPFWVPIAEYRATPPTTDRERERFDYLHQDAPYNPGIDSRILWIPLAEIDSEMGGVVLAEGLTEKINRHPIVVAGINEAIPVETLPADSWRRTKYEAGDVLLMNLWTPHTGLSNLSDRFRLSLDIRIMARSAHCPLIGKILRISAATLAIECYGRTVELLIGPQTYVRNYVGGRITGDAIANSLHIGSSVIVAYEGDVATVVRPPH